MFAFSRLKHECKQLRFQSVWRFRRLFITWSRSFRRAILLVTSSCARSSFSCSSRMLASCRRRFSLCRHQTHTIANTCKAGVSNTRLEGQNRARRILQSGPRRKLHFHIFTAFATLIPKSLNIRKMIYIYFHLCFNL